MKEYFVSTQLELKQALVSAAKNNEVATINLAGGNYGSFTMNSKYDKEYPAVRGLDFNNVTIRSADESNRATFDKISIKGYDNLTFDSLNVHLTKYTGAVSISDAKNVIFQNSDIRGLGVDPATWTPENARDTVGKMSGIGVQNSENVVIHNNSIQHVAWGTAASTVDGYTLSNNLFQNNLGDNMRVFSNMTNVVIDSNTSYGIIGDALPGNHKDHLQLAQTSYNFKHPSGNIAITNNTFISDTEDSAGTQLLFGRSEALSEGNAEAMYTGHFIVSKNLAIGGSSHGFSVANLAGGANQIFSNNVAIWNGHGSIPQIRSSGSGDVAFENNIAGGGFNGQGDKNFLINYSDPNHPNYVGKIFVNAQKPLTEITAKDLQFSPDFYQNFGKAMGFPEPSYADDGFTAHIVYRDAENNDTSTSGFEQLKTFDASYSTGEDGKPLGDNATYKWVFEDGTEKFGKIVTHSIADGGTENVKLFVTVGGKTLASEKLLKLFDTHVFSADLNGKILDDSSTETDMSWNGEENYRIMEDGEHAAELDGTNYIKLDRGGNVQDFFNAKEFTIAATVSLDAANLTKVNTLINSHTKFNVRIEGGDTIAVGIGSALKFKGANFADGKEHQIVTTVDGNQVTVYFDGQSLGTQTISQQGIATMGSWAVEIGFTPFKTWGLQGTIRDVEVFRKALSPEEIKNFGESGEDAGKNTGLLTGTVGDDILNAGLGNSTIYGLDGNDNITGNAGNDFVTGDGGNDIIDGNAGHDSLWGGDGNDTLNGGDGNDLMSGDADDDSVSGGAGDDSLFGWTGNDVLDGGAGNDLLSGEEGKDTYVFTGAFGNDTVSDNGGILSMDGTTVSGTARAVSGQAGKYLTVIGGQTFEVSWAGDLRDTKSSADLTLKKQGDDLNSITLDDFENGAYGIKLAVNEGKHIIDTTKNYSGSTVTGTDGNDTLEGGFGKDTLVGGDGDDLVRGGLHKDVLYGGKGDDTLIGGHDGDQMFGGEGADLYVFSNILDSGKTKWHIDAIMDFERGIDKIDLSAMSYTGIEAFDTSKEVADGILTYVVKGDKLEVWDQDSTFKFHVSGTQNLTANDLLF